MTREINSIIQRVIPILVNSCGIERKQILADASTKKTSPKRGDLWISQEEVNNLTKFEKNIVTLIEVKDEDTKPIIFDEMYKEVKDGQYSLKDEFKDEFDSNYEIYSEGKGKYVGKYKNDKWFDALIQAKYKSSKQGLNFFGVSNCIQIIFYHTESLKPIIIKKQDDFIPVDFWVTYELLLQFKESIGSDNILKIKAIKTAVDNPSEYEFQKFLNKIHNKNVFRFDEEIIIESLLTFVFFKFLEERMNLNNEKLPINGVLWSDFTRGAKSGEEGKHIIENMHQQLNLLKDAKSGYKQEYKEFTTILTIPKTLRDAEDSHETIFEIWSEFSRYYFHGCGFDIYGSIYEEFASPKQKEQLGQFYTRRHISKILAYLTLKNFDDVKEGFKVCDPACGSGGLLTECYEAIKKNMLEKYGEIPEKKKSVLKKDVFYGFDIKDYNVEKAKLNMFFAGDGHTHIEEKDSILKLPKITEEDDSEGFDVVIANPPYGNGSEYYKDYVTWMNTKRHELVFVERMIKSLKYGGRFGFVVPDGVLENPRWEDFRRRLMEQVKVESIISVPVHAFAPYCKQKTYLIIGNRRTYERIKKLTHDKDFEKEALDTNTIKKDKFEDIKEKIWMYIIDYDGFANSDKRFPTDLSIVNQDGEVEFIHNDLFELKDKYLIGDNSSGEIKKINQLDLNGEKKGIKQSDGNYLLNKADFFDLNKSINEKNWLCLIPESYLRPYKPRYLSFDSFKKEKGRIEKELKDFLGGLNDN